MQPCDILLTCLAQELGTKILGLIAGVRYRGATTKTAWVLEEPPKRNPLAALFLEE
jgi:hypothetical protein